MVDIGYPVLTVNLHARLYCKYQATLKVDRALSRVPRNKGGLTILRDLITTVHHHGRDECVRESLDGYVISGCNFSADELGG